MDKKIKVLYIYGYGSNEHSETKDNLQEVLGNHFEVVSLPYDQKNPKDSLKKINLYIKYGHIDVVIGSSLGGFYALKQNQAPRIVINPCMFPSQELPKIGCSKKVADKYLEFESYDTDNYDRELTMGVFGSHDELINYQDFYMKHYGSYFTISAGHRPTKFELANIAYEMRKKIDYWMSPEHQKKLSMFDSVDGLY